MQSPVTANVKQLFDGKHIAIVGLGVTGKSTIKFLHRYDCQITAFDANAGKWQKDGTLNTSFSSELMQKFSVPTVQLFSSDTDFSDFDMVIVSPGINPNQTCFSKAKAKQVPILNDIGVFALHNKAKVIGVTGSNGKSTVVDMLNKCLQAVGFRCAIGGNFGRSALDLIDESLDIIVLELSSFQLELPIDIQFDVGCVLNVTPDHIDRHGTFDHYALAKRQIYKSAKFCVFNRDDSFTFPKASNLDERKEQTDSLGTQKISSNMMRSGTFGLSNIDSLAGHSYLQGQTSGYTVNTVHTGNIHTHIKDNAVYINELCIFRDKDVFSEHNLLNAMACICALSQFCPSDERREDYWQTVVEVLENYQGLPHRFALVAKHTLPNHSNVSWINDSKATNPGASIAAIKSVPETNTLILIAGGDSKGADLDDLLKLIESRCRLLIVLGKDAHLFTSTSVPSIVVDDLKAAVLQACEALLTMQQDTFVLLSPACASIDMFRNYQERGEVFEQAVSQQLLKTKWLTSAETIS